MNIIFKDLFPETLLVQNEGGQSYTTSLTIAKHVGKLHKNIIQAMDDLNKEREAANLDRLKFQPITYLDSRNREQVDYKMNRKGCTLLILRLRGKNATIWQDDFYNSFENMETYIKDALVRQADALYFFKPHFKTILAADAQGLPRKAIITLTGHKSTASITANRSRMREAGLLPAKNGGAA
jgi:Rha family phage regulatory protein